MKNRHPIPGYRRMPFSWSFRYVVWFTVALTGCSAPSPPSQLDPELFRAPSGEYRPETWFHLIGGNVDREGLSVDLEAVSAAGLRGIQLFHGRGGAWPEVEPQIQTLSERWDDMIGHVGREAGRLGLDLTMQNCPGWAMSGGPWITPDKAMRHLIWSRTDVVGGGEVNVDLPRPQPSSEEWRDYRDVAVIAFPRPADDSGTYLRPVSTASNRPDLPWAEMLAGEEGAMVRIEPTEAAAWLEVSFAEPTPLRNLEIPPVERLMLRRNFDPASAVELEAWSETNGWISTGVRPVPRGTWQDRLPEFPLVLAYADYPARKFRITFRNAYAMGLDFLRFSSAARTNDHYAQAGYALRSRDFGTAPDQDSAAWLSSEDIVDLTDLMDDGGQIHWSPPPGDWIILRFGHVNTGVKNKPAPPEATGFECDKLSPRGAEQHFAGYIGRLTEPGAPLDGQLKGMLIDSWECYTQTWTPTMEADFAERRAYALRNWLPALAGWVVDNHERSEGFLRDWRATVSDLLVDNYFGRLAELGHERGLKLSFETAIGDVAPGDILQYFGRADIPMCEFWQPNDPHWGGFEAKPVHPTVSAAHLYGKPIIAAEAFTNIGLTWGEHFFPLKHRADQHFALGVNHLVFHTYTHNPRQDVVPGTSFGGRIGTPFIRGQTWWQHMPVFTDYLARCQYLLQRGQPVADVLWYLGDDLDHKPPQSTPFPAGYKFDYLNADVLLNRLSVVDGELQTPEGLRWKVIWLPEKSARGLTVATLRRLRELLREGATVVADAPPLRNPSLSGGSEAEREHATLVNVLWGERPPAEGEKTIGAGRIFWGRPLEETLAQLGVRPDVVGAQSATWCHRRTEAEDVYFVAAARQAPLRTNLRFRAGGTPAFWDPLSGSVTPVAAFYRDGDYVSVPLDLPAAGSVFVVFSGADDDASAGRLEFAGTPLWDAADRQLTDTAAPYPYLGLTPEDTLQPWVPFPFRPVSLRKGTGEMIAWENGNYLLTVGNEETSIEMQGTERTDLSEDWALSFPSGWDAPATMKLPRLISWSTFAKAGARHFSGTARYEKRFVVSDVDGGARYLLDLGRVTHIAAIHLNGRYVGTLWAPPFRVDVTDYLRTGENELTVELTNTWRNRLILDAGLPEKERKTWALHPPPADAEVEVTGLLGPVVLRKGILLRQ